MRRRNFLKQSALGISAAMVPFHGYCTSVYKSYPLGLQLFSIRDAIEEDLLGTLEILKELGYQDFELYGFDPEKIAYYGYKAAEFKSLLDTMGFTASSGHYDFSSYFDESDDRLRWYVDASIEGALTLEKRYITWPWLAPEYRNMEGFSRLTEKLNRIGEQVSGAGLGFAYHNHGYEFSDLGGFSGYDLILRETDPELVKLQMDIYWVMHEGITTPKELVAAQPGRFVMWHIKDMHKESRDYTELGNGSIDFKEIMPDPKLAGLEYYYLEQGGNYAQNSMKSAADSASYFKKHLQSYF